MKYSVTQRQDWPNAVNETYRFFNGKVYAGEILEERILFY